MVNKYCAIVCVFKLNEVKKEYDIFKAKIKAKIEQLNCCGTEKFFVFVVILLHYLQPKC